MLAFITALLAFRIKDFKKQSGTISSVENFKKKEHHSLSPDWNELKDWIEEIDIPPIPGAGNYKWKISTTNDSAQFYFNQGINMYYSFHIIEAMASFKKAAKFDPTVQCFIGHRHWRMGLILMILVMLLHLMHWRQVAKQSSFCNILY